MLTTYEITHTQDLKGISRTLVLIISILIIYGCQYEDIEPVETQKRRMSNVRWNEVPILTENLRANLGASNDGLYSYGGQEEALDFRIDWDNITQYTDSLGNVSYTLMVIDQVNNPYVFRNIVVRQYNETSFSKPMLYTYEISDEFKAIYDQSLSIHGFTGKVKKQVINADLSIGLSSANIKQQRGTVSDSDCPGSETNVGGSSGSGDTSTGPGSNPEPGSGITYEICHSEWIDFEDSESCGDGCVTASRSILVTTCYTVEMTRGDNEPCDDGEVAAIFQDDDCARFLALVDKVLNHEGGYVNNPVDKGGPTNRGIAWITWRQYASEVLGVDPTLDNLKKLKAEEAKAIYRHGFWNKSGGDAISDGDTRYLLFDFYVNSGANAVMTAQKVLNELGENLTVDGGIGQNTLKAINNADPVEFYNNLKKARKDFYDRIVARDSSQLEFYEGWMQRLNSFKDKTSSNRINVNCN